MQFEFTIKKVVEGSRLSVYLIYSVLVVQTLMGFGFQSQSLVLARYLYMMVVGRLESYLHHLYILCL
jgi:hypothetical protein